ncbi:TPA: hypothetical protein ACGO9Z_001839 [Streptococcus suis]|nr:hypothetical protein [Streptococcus suis]
MKKWVLFMASCVFLLMFVLKILDAEWLAASWKLVVGCLGAIVFFPFAKEE